MSADRTTITTDEITLKRMERRMESEGCPAATRISPPDGGFSIVCGVIERENRETPEEMRHHVPALVTERTDPGTIHGYCTTRGYAHCPVWRCEIARRERDDKQISAVDVNYGGGVANRL
jgi:hypothetical protein